MSARSDRPWWSTWPGALGAGVASLVLGSAGLLSLLVFVLLPVDDVAGTDLVAVSGAPVAAMIASWVGAIVLLALPVLTTVWARRTWLGYTLLGLALSAVGGVAGLFWIGVL